MSTLNNIYCVSDVDPKDRIVDVECAVRCEDEYSPLFFELKYGYFESNLIKLCLKYFQNFYLFDHINNAVLIINQNEDQANDAPN